MPDFHQEVVAVVILLAVTLPIALGLLYWRHRRLHPVWGVAVDLTQHKVWLRHGGGAGTWETPAGWSTWDPTDKDLVIVVDPVDELARALRSKMEHIDPTHNWDKTWAKLSERDRLFYRVCVEDLLLRSDLVRQALARGDNSTTA